MNNELWQASQEAWLALTPEGQFLVRVAGVLVASFVAAGVVGWWVGRKLRDAQFDDAFRRPWAPPTASAQADAHLLTPTRLVTFLVRLTVWGIGVWCLARFYGRLDITGVLEWIAGRVWSLAGVTLVALYLSRLFLAMVLEAVKASPLKQKLDAWMPAEGIREPRVSGAVVVVGFVIDAMMILLVSLVAADLMGWTLTGTALAATWQLILHVLAAGVALLLGWAGARWVRTQPAPDAGQASSPARVGHFAGIGVMGCATLLAILLLAGNYPTYFGLALLVLFLLLLWPAQVWLPDIYAGLILRVHRVKEVRLDGAVIRLGAVGLVQTEVLHPEGNRSLRNRVVLEAHLSSHSGEDGPSPDAESSSEKPAEPSSPNGKPEEAGKV